MHRTRLLLALVAIAGSATLVACVPPPTTGGNGFAPAGCYDSPIDDAPDLKFNGKVNVTNNLDIAWSFTTQTASTDGTCTGLVPGPPYSFTLVRAADEAAAITRCEGLALTNGAEQLQLAYPAFPADAWFCNPPAEA